MKFLTWILLSRVFKGNHRKISLQINFQVVYFSWGIYKAVSRCSADRTRECDLAYPFPLKSMGKVCSRTLPLVDIRHSTGVWCTLQLICGEPYLYRFQEVIVLHSFVVLSKRLSLSSLQKRKKLKHCPIKI